MRSLLLDDDGIREAAHHLADFLVAYEQRLRDRRVSPELDRNALQRIIVEPPPAGGRSVADP